MWIVLLLGKVITLDAGRFSRRLAIVKLISWNVNGLRAALKKGFEDYIAEEDPDVICLQETRLSDEQIPEDLLPAYPYKYWNHAEKKGYSGVAILSKKKPKEVHYDMGVKKHDREGRVLRADFDRFQLVTVYTPNAGQDNLGRLPYRVQWDKAFLKYIKSMDETSPVVLCGDLNVAHNEIDIARPQANRNKSAGFTDEERAGFSNLLDAEFIDTFRAQHPDAKDMYTWWSYRSGARRKNIGWRIDYFVVSKRFHSKVKDAFIRMEREGSDHCPVGVVLKR